MKRSNLKVMTDYLVMCAMREHILEHFSDDPRFMSYVFHKFSEYFSAGYSVKDVANLFIVSLLSTVQRSLIDDKETVGAGSVHSALGNSNLN